jgi:hypothetical protein
LPRLQFLVEPAGGRLLHLQKISSKNSRAGCRGGSVALPRGTPNSLVLLD